VGARRFDSRSSLADARILIATHAAYTALVRWVAALVMVGTIASPLQSECDASYPDVCIPPPPPDLDCGDVGATNFTVLRPDPHGFDRDRDGIGCEER
jgi:hypothetical protein